VFREDFTGSAVQVVDASNALVKFSPGGPTWQGWWPVKNLSNDNSYQVGLDLEWYDLSALSLDGVSTLTITATHDNVHSANGTAYPYTSGMIHTSGFFNQKFGYFECKMKCPSGGGNWPSFWTLPSTFNPHTPPEVDIFENFGNPDSHKASNWGANSTVLGDVIAVDVTQWHVYGLKWTSNSLVWYIDGVAKATEGTLSAIPTVAQFLLVTLGVRGTDQTTYTTQVDYMAAWK
jgi:beta-glucanase (GH16 family)